MKKIQNVAECSKKKTQKISRTILDTVQRMTWKQLKINGYTKKETRVLFGQRVNTNQNCFGAAR